MLVFAGIAMFVGAFIINNTFSIIVAQRTREMAMLRAIGASGRQVKRAVLAEATVGRRRRLGGRPAGRHRCGQRPEGVAARRSVSTSPAVRRSSQTSTIVVSMAIGVLVTVLSAVMPARRASKVPPIAALRDVALDRSACLQAPT